MSRGQIRHHHGAPQEVGEHKMKISDVARKTDLHRNTITMLYNETAVRVDIVTIDRLCKLFNCGVGDLFEFKQDEG
ncbi:MAG: helix-turn-helix transcriptional regulator [Deltaproteobacteria bacterium]|nr:helix-turn-helix transcriptional regulator [Deltaproteobacteria bacterium]